MRRSRVTGVVAGVALLAGGLLASCANLDGLSGGAPLDDGGKPVFDAPVVMAESGDDAPPPPPDSGDSGSTPPVDAPAETSMADVVAPDTGRDAAGSMDANDAGGLWCSTVSPTPTFCADFDEGAFDSGWSSSQATNGTIGLDNALYTSPHDSLVASSATTNANVQAAVFNQFAASGSAYHYAFDLHVDAVSTGAEPVFAEVQLFEGTTLGYGLTFIVESGGALIEESYTNGGVQFVDTPLSMAPPIGTWTRVTIDIGAPPAGNVTVHIGGTTVLDAHPVPTGSANGVPVIAAGLELFPGGTIGPCKGHIDDVTFQIDP